MFLYICYKYKLDVDISGLYITVIGNTFILKKYKNKERIKKLKEKCFTLEIIKKIVSNNYYVNHRLGKSIYNDNGNDSKASSAFDNKNYYTSINKNLLLKFS
ncbi:hypothetical protein EDEG_03591 [Edhazardia aedis USNM 41457]|uniref:Uncharacterized protein n=1 Tax=Edhazardia aedis (strain USNM 41457) TaxID=1003232 RepID=J9DKM7_EDHAE|nr:hypothetical protein EDEG_03591 [Edhazardia aedis USNM 41457]|eukprot:EJW01947.1 hypothetical protein EDEG_03591 [Edhazardia aedis USNM 41457]